MPLKIHQAAQIVYAAVRKYENIQEGASAPRWDALPDSERERLVAAAFVACPEPKKAVAAAKPAKDPKDAKDAKDAVKPPVYASASEALTAVIFAALQPYITIYNE